MNALALFWVTDSISERSAGTNAVMDHPVYEMSSERISRHKDPSASAGQVSSTNHRRSRISWSPFVAVDRGFRKLFDREPATRETGTLDVEVSFSIGLSHAPSQRPGITDRSPHRNERGHLLPSRRSRKGQQGQVPSLDLVYHVFFL